MSVKVMSLVWDSDLPTNQKMVLLAYADSASHDGRDIYPGHKRMSTMTGYVRQTVAKITDQLLETGVLVQVAAGHRGQRAEYVIVLDHPLLKVSPDETLSGEVAETPETVDSVASAEDSVASGPDSVVPRRHLPSEPSTLNRPSRGKPREPDPIWEFFVHPDTFELPVETDAQRKRVGRLVREVRPLVEADEATAQWNELVSRARNYPNMMPDGTLLTPEAFVKHYTALGRPPLVVDKRGAEREALREALRGL